MMQRTPSIETQLIFISQWEWPLPKLTGRLHFSIYRLIYSKWPLRSEGNCILIKSTLTANLIQIDFGDWISCAIMERKLSFSKWMNFIRVLLYKWSLQYNCSCVRALFFVGILLLHLCNRANNWIDLLSRF